MKLDDPIKMADKKWYDDVRMTIIDFKRTHRIGFFVFMSMIKSNSLF